MNAYQQKWLQVLKAANLPKWEIDEEGDDIVIEMPHITDLKLIRDNLPEVVARLALDIDTPKERLKFIFKNGYERFEYVLNPREEDLGQA
jgi:hypothetical protein